MSSFSSFRQTNRRNCESMVVLQVCSYIYKFWFSGNFMYYIYMLPCSPPTLSSSQPSFIMNVFPILVPFVCQFVSCGIEFNKDHVCLEVTIRVWWAHQWVQIELDTVLCPLSSTLVADRSCVSDRAHELIIYPSLIVERTQDCVGPV